MMHYSRPKIPADVGIQREPGEMAFVICRQCHKEIGRLHTVPAEDQADQAEINAEIRLIAEEHRSLCGARS